MYRGINRGATSAHSKCSIERKSETIGTSLSHVCVTEMRQLFVSGCFYVNIGREGKQPEKSRVFICKTFFNASEVLVYENKLSFYCLLPVKIGLCHFVLIFPLRFIRA